MRVQLVVNQTRVRTDTELGAWMSGLVSRHYGVALDELGHVEHDDTVWLTVRRNKPLLVDSPASKSARNIERIARRVLALATSKAERPRPCPIPVDEPTLYSVIGVTRSASDEEIFAGIDLLAASEGILTEPAGGTTIAVLKKLAESGELDPDAVVVAIITGNGLKTLDEHPPKPWPSMVECDSESMLSVLSDFQHEEADQPLPV